MALPAMINVEKSEEAPREVTTCNVSSRGVYLEYVSPLEVGMRLEFVLMLPVRVTKGAAVRVKCMGQVVRVDRGKDEGEGPLGIAATIERYEFDRKV